MKLYKWNNRRIKLIEKLSLLWKNIYNNSYDNFYKNNVFCRQFLSQKL